jgi:hypothetical protein
VSAPVHPQRNGTAQTAQPSPTTDGEATEQVAPADPYPPLRSIDDIKADAPQINWVWAGYVAQGAVTLLYGSPKGGKSTLLFHLLRSIELGHPFLGRRTVAMSAVYLSEEHHPTLEEKIDESGLEHTKWMTRLDLFDGKAFADHMKRAVYWGQKEGHGLIVVDTFAAWGRLRGEDENKSGPTQEVMEVCQWAAAQGFAVILVHHTNKAEGVADTRRIRGSSAIHGAVEVAVEVAREHGAPKDDTKRILWSESRFRETPWKLTGILKPDGYALAETPESAMARKDADAVLGAVRGQPGMTMTELRAVAGIQAGRVRPIVEEQEALGLVRCEGSGRKNDPRRIYPV